MFQSGGLLSIGLEPIFARGNILRLAWQARFSTTGACPPLLLLGLQSARYGDESTRGKLFHDEPFRLRDVQFHGPKIRVETSAAREEVGNLCRIRSRQWASRLP